MARSVKLTVLLSELDTLITPEQERLVLRFAQQAEEAGYDGVHLIDHVVMGPSAGFKGRPQNPRAFRWVGNQDPAQHMPSQIVMMSAIAAVTSRIRLHATATLAPLRPPLLNAKQWATLDLISGGRLTITPIAGWQWEEYAAFGIPFEERSGRLDEQLEIMRLVWRETPASYAGKFYRFSNIYVMPKPVQPNGPEIIIGGDGLTSKIIERIVKYGSGYTLTSPLDADGLARLAAAMTRAGRHISELKTSGLLMPIFPDAHKAADLARSIEAGVPAMLAQGVDSITIKPSQFIDDPAAMPAFLREVDRRIAALA